MLDWPIRSKVYAVHLAFPLGSSTAGSQCSLTDCLYLRVRRLGAVQISSRATALSATNTHSALLAELRILERKMGLVLTLFKASVWSVVTADTDAMADEENHEQDAQHGSDPNHHDPEMMDSLVYDDPGGANQEGHPQQYWDQRTDGYAYDDGQGAY